jgi:hypothetical protein
MSRLSGMSGQVAWNMADLAASAEESKTVTIPGAKLGDFVFCSLSIDYEQGSLTAQVSAANTVEATYINDAVDPSDLAAAVLRVKVIPFDDI